MKNIFSKIIKVSLVIIIVAGLIYMKHETNQAMGCVEVDGTNYCTKDVK